MYRIQYEYGEVRGVLDRIPFQEEVKVLPKEGKVLVIMSDKAGDVAIHYVRVEQVIEPQEDSDLYHVLVRDHIQGTAPKGQAEVAKAHSPDAADTMVD